MYSTSTITYSDIQGGWTGTGNIDADPQFIGGDDYRLLVSSPCIDAGTALGAPMNDRDDNPRPAGGAYDMGAYEYQVLDEVPIYSCYFVLWIIIGLTCGFTKRILFKQP
jgi:hypothetical protein